MTKKILFVLSIGCFILATCLTALADDMPGFRDFKLGMTSGEVANIMKTQFRNGILADSSIIGPVIKPSNDNVLGNMPDKPWEYPRLSILRGYTDNGKHQGNVIFVFVDDRLIQMQVNVAGARPEAVLKTIKEKYAGKMVKLGSMDDEYFFGRGDNHEVWARYNPHFTKNIMVIYSTDDADKILRGLIAEKKQQTLEKQKKKDAEAASKL